MNTENNDIVTLERGGEIMTRDQMMDHLTTLGVDVIGTSERFGSGRGGIWINGENGDNRLNYWTENYDRYTFGIRNDLNDEVERHGWWFEWYDAGTLMCFPQ